MQEKYQKNVNGWQTLTLGGQAYAEPLPARRRRRTVTVSAGTVFSEDGLPCVPAPEAANAMAIIQTGIRWLAGGVS